MFHFLYAAKLKDLRSFVLGATSNIKLEYTKINSKRRESVCQIVDEELKRIFKNLGVYGVDLKKKAEMMRPRLSDLARNCVTDAIKCT